MSRGCEGRVAIVTGAGRGIGREEALLLASEGARVVVNDLGADVDGSGGRHSEVAEEVAAEIRAGGGEAVANADDIADWEGAQRLINSAVETFGRLDVLVNNAGIGERIDAITDIDDDAWRRTLAVNLDGAFFCLRAAIPRLRAAGGGRIVNVSSGAAHTGGAIGAHYAASKAGMLALTAKAARELAGDGIAVNAVLPSVIETDMLSALARDEAARTRLRAQFPIGRFGQPEEVATVVRFLCESAPAYLTGECIPLRGGRR